MMRANVSSSLAALLGECWSRYGVPASTHEALGVITEEYTELIEAVRRNSRADIYREAIDLAAAAIRLADACDYMLTTEFSTRSGLVP